MVTIRSAGFLASEEQVCREIEGVRTDLATDDGISVSGLPGWSKHLGDRPVDRYGQGAFFY